MIKIIKLRAGNSDNQTKSTCQLVNSDYNRLWFALVWFYGIATIAGYLMHIHIYLYTYISNI